MAGEFERIIMKRIANDLAAREITSQITSAEDKELIGRFDKSFDEERAIREAMKKRKLTDDEEDVLFQNVVDSIPGAEEALNREADRIDYYFDLLNKQKEM